MDKSELAFWLALAVLFTIQVVAFIQHTTQPTEVNLTEALKEGKIVYVPLKSGGYAQLCNIDYGKEIKICSGKTITYTNFDFDTPFFISRCAMGTNDVILLFKKNCTLIFKSIEFLPSKGYINISAYSNGTVQYILCILDDNGKYTLDLGNLKLKCSKIMYFNRSGEHNLFINLSSN